MSLMGQPCVHDVLGIPYGKVRDMALRTKAFLSFEVEGYGKTIGGEVARKEIIEKTMS